MYHRYTCACGWSVKSKSIEALVEKISEHGFDKHPETALDREKIRNYVDPETP